ncbi:hypothetical protein OG746_27490 [Streptomyces sp. NBC_01016]|uniref:hypothetical protein n=1 Tax=Streptomyces sp. NBC_01016 TaxID=2903720 RepID=UPI002252A326|nr:hypothetical protein [Streptomyces sp. NBC_01016]MCX4832488.1 hypothetical protein [Streptomyces sp. NBC_01016]
MQSSTDVLPAPTDGLVVRPTVDDLITHPTADAPAVAPPKSARRLAMEEARRSKRPSRADRQAGASPHPERTLDDAGFPRLLQQTLTAARGAASTREMVEILITLGGRLDADTARRSLTRAETAAVRMLTAPGRTPGAGEPGGPERARATSDPDEAQRAGAEAAFTSTLALSPQGRLVVTVPQRRSLPAEAAATGVAARITWSRDDLAEYVRLFADVRRRTEHEVAECRGLLDRLGQDGRTAAVDALRGAVFLVPPVMLYKDDSVFSNLKDEKNLTGKSLLPTHPDCFFHHLDRLPLELWTDDEAVVVACLWLAYSSGGPNRVESFNGVQLSLENVADNFRTTRGVYLQAAPELVIDELADAGLSGVELPSIESLLASAGQIADARARLVAERRIHYDINATIRRKSERALPRAERPGPHELGVCERLGELLPGAGRDFAGVLDVLDDAWLQAPRGGFATGFEALVEATVHASVDLFGADFAMSRGIRSLPKLIDALGRRDWAEIVSWELPDFYCCVVPSARAFELHGGDRLKVADSAWAMSARMQYNTWHVMPGNLPKDPAVQARDFLSPHVLPDLAVHSDLHHRGHVANLIRFSARSPEPVRITDEITFKSLTDLRVLRCTGEPFDQADLVGVTHVARFLAQLSERVAAAAVAGRPIEVTSFDHRWHRTSIAGPVPSLESHVL